MSKNTIKISKEDNFVWKLLTKEQARAIHQSGTMPVFVLNDDDSESLICDNQDLESYIKAGAEIGIEVGFADYREVAELKNRIETHDFYYQRSDDASAYNSGRLNLQRIVELSTLVPREDYVRWWNKSAPESHQFIK